MSLRSLYYVRTSQFATQNQVSFSHLRFFILFGNDKDTLEGTIEVKKRNGHPQGNADDKQRLTPC
jgi:hypothetical protein